ncbi:toll/interleukin-1 receptor domain-containing protein [Amycolatopsis sp. NPDC051716]|uniref:toll/interleukin-1 receptor domain-containing protein n=1 Tax=Amycolatopsis sp. NPDC051716 TaxID=3155804 RepID=UPI00341EE9B0
MNYRTDDSAHVAAALYDRLVDRFGPEQAFRDARTLVAGDHSPSTIRAAARRADVLVAVIGPKWLERRSDGSRRIDDPEDWVRWEIETAYQRGIPVLPVFLDDTPRPAKEDLPGELVRLRQSQAHWICHQSQGSDIAGVVSAVLAQAPGLVLREFLVQPPQLSDDPLPSALLRAEYGIVPFEADRRRNELDDLRAWCAAAVPLSAYLVTGPAGEGKTRLAGQLAAELAADGWIAGVLAESVPAGRLAELARLDHSLLLIIDYVEGRADQLAALVEAMTERGEHPRVRLLLVGRSAGDWLSRIQESGNSKVAELFRRATRLPLRPLVHADDRHAEFTRALQAFGQHLDQRVGDVVAPADLADGAYDRVLDLHAAALAALLDQTGDGGPAGDTRDPVLRVLHHEKRYWKRSAAKVGTDDATLALLGYVVALSTLFGAATRQEALDLLEHWVPDRTRLSLVLRWLQEMYPGQEALNPLRPDRLGEDHVATELRHEPDLALADSPQRTPQQISQALTVLGRAAPRHGHVPDTISGLIDVSPEQRVPVAMGVATLIEDPRPLVRSITTTMGDADPTLIDLAVENLPESSEALGAFGVHALSRAIALHERLAPRNERQLAQLNLRLGSAYRALNRPDQAIGPATTAAQAYTELAAAEPRSFRPFEAQALNSLALTQRDLGQYDDALETIDRALERYTELSAQGTAAYRKVLAAVTDTKATCLYELQRAEESLDVAAQALELRRQLAGEESSLYASDYATALNNFALRNRENDHVEAAARHAAEAVRLYELLAEDQPDAFRRDHAIALSTLALTRTDLGDPAGALAAIERSAEVLRLLAASNPETHLPLLASVTKMLAIRLGNAGQHPEARSAAQEAADHYEELARSRPAVFRPELAMALNALANRQAQLGDLDGALASSTRAAELSRERPAQGAERLPELAVALNTQAMVLFKLARLDEANVVLTECVELRRRLANENRGPFVPELAESLRNLGRVLTHSNKPGPAAEAFGEAAEIFLGLCNVAPARFAVPLRDTYLDLGSLPLEPAGVLDALAAAWSIAEPFDDGTIANRIAARLADLAARYGDDIVRAWQQQDVPPLPEG